ncbi:ATP-dependent endonuclease [bacterium]|nr:ATP-dependent endonuclease [bacterium]
MKFKKIPIKHLIISTERLLRFKPTEEKYSRVFKDILNKYCIFENSKEKEDLTLEDKINIASKIINNSTCDIQEDSFIKNLINDIEKKSFAQNKESEKYLKNSINFNALLKTIEKENTYPSIKYLILKNENRSKKDGFLRKKAESFYPVEEIILAEGITEEILLPKLSKCLNIDFFENGAMVIQAGGKNQVGKKYLKLLEEVKLPIKILLDNDAEEIRKILEEKLRKEDKLCLIKIGEFEDIIPLELIIDALNENFKYELKERIKKSEFAEKNTKSLSEIYRTRGLGDFKKAEFAHLIEKYVEISKKAYNFDDLNKNILSVIKI